MNKLLKTAKRVDSLLSRKTNQIYFKFAKSDVACNICNYKANKLASDAWHLHTTCPECGSGVRQRLLWAALENLPGFSISEMIEGKAVLHFSPEKALGNLLNKYAATYKTADFFAEGYTYENIDFDIDISNMLSIDDASFDCVVACDVLEHVPDHIKGMKEVYRILKKGGHCIFTVPQRDYLKTTFEDLSEMSQEARTKVFGQFDHLRIYGDDFSSMLEQCGFRVTAIDENSFSKEIAERNVLFPPVLSEKENATNFRKVFIGTK